MRKPITRRKFLKGAGIAAAGVAIAGCAPQVVEREKVVEQTVVVKEKEEVIVEVTSTPSACAMDWNPTQPPAPKKYDPPVILSSPICDSDPAWLGNDNRTNNPMYNRLMDALGVGFSVHWQATGDACAQLYNTDLAAGTLPDIRNVNSAVEMARLIENGAVEDITDIWEATASELTKQKKEYPNGRLWIPVTREGRIFGMAHSNGPAWNVEQIGLVRKDILDKIGAPIPQTLDELTATAKEILKAGLAKYPIVTRSRLYTYALSLDPVWGAFGAMPEHWLLKEDGSLEYGSLRPGAKEALNVLSGWYKDGILFPEFYTITNPASTGQLASGEAVIGFGPWWLGGSITTWEKDNPDWQFSVMPLPKGPTGLQGRQGTPNPQHAVVFRKGIEPVKVEAFINAINWAIERHVNWEQYQQYGEWRNSHAFTEGYEWEFDENCELKTGPVANSEGTYKYTAFWGVDFAYMSYPDYQADIFNDMQKWLSQDLRTLNKAQRYLISNPKVRRELELYLEGYNTRSLRMNNMFDGVPTQAMKEFSDALDKLEMEYRIGIVTGQKPLSAFDEFVSEWKKNGGDAITAEVNDWWQAQKKS